MKFFQILRREKPMIHMDLRALLIVKASVFMMQMIYSSISLKTSDLIMMTMLTFLEAFSVKVKKVNHLGGLEDSGDLMMMTIFLVKVFHHFHHHLLVEWEVVESQNPQVLWQKQCNFYKFNFRNGKTVTVKKTTITKPDGTK